MTDQKLHGFGWALEQMEAGGSGFIRRFSDTMKTDWYPVADDLLAKDWVEVE